MASGKSRTISRSTRRGERAKIMRRPVAVALAGLVALVGVVSLQAEDAEGKRWWSYVEMLANDGMQGRQTGSPEHRKAADYVASQFEQAGLKPAGVNGFVQPV